jgi:hypothetical protein
VTVHSIAMIAEIGDDAAWPASPRRHCRPPCQSRRRAGSATHVDAVIKCTVTVIRGVFTIFSLDLDEMAARLWRRVVLAPRADDSGPFPADASCAAKLPILPA